MELNKHAQYRNISFCADSRHCDFYAFSNVKDLAGACETSKEEIIKCRTLGILQNEHGKFWLVDMNATGIHPEVKVQVSMVYLKSPPQSTVVPYPVQMFGTAQWKNRPVIFPKILQVLSIPVAIRIKDIMENIATKHLATNYKICLQHEPQEIK